MLPNLRLRRCAEIAATALLLTPAVRADAGIPMLPLAYPVVLLFLVPVIGIETLFLRIRLRTDWWRTLKGVSVVNVVTLVLGYPLAWLISFLLELLFIAVMLLIGKAGGGALVSHMDRVPMWMGVVLLPAWLGPGEQLWPVILAFCALLVPAFLLSGWVESWMIDRYDLLRWERPDRRAVWIANVWWSYVFLAALGSAVLYAGLKTNLIERLLP